MACATVYSDAERRLKLDRAAGIKFTRIFTLRPCALTHCECGTHDLEHNCVFPDRDSEIEAAERKAGWDPTP